MEMETTETSNATQAMRLRIGFKHYKPIWQQISPFSKGIMIIHMLITVGMISMMVTGISTIEHWEFNVLIVNAIVYVLLQLGTFLTPLYFVMAANHHEIPDLIEFEEAKRSVLMTVDRIFLATLIMGLYCLWSDSSAYFDQKFHTLHQITLIYVIIHTVYIFRALVVLMTVLFLLPFIYLYAGRLEIQENRRLAAMGAPAEIINAIPIFKFRKTQENQVDVEQPIPPSIEILSTSGSNGKDLELKNIHNDQKLKSKTKPKRRFLLLPFLRNNEEEKEEAKAAPLPQQDRFLDISEEDAKCAICISEYEEGESLRQLQCNHHFHVDCIDEWLRVNAKCPLCIQGILDKSES